MVEHLASAPAIEQINHNSSYMRPSTLMQDVGGVMHKISYRRFLVRAAGRLFSKNEQ